MWALCGLSSMCGRISSGYLADRTGSCLTCLKLFMMTSSVVTFGWLGCTTFPTIILYAVLITFLSGAVLSLVPAVCAELFGVQSLGSIMGLLMSAQAIGSLFSTPIAGSLYDQTQSYDATILTAASLLFTGAVMLCFIPEQPRTVSSLFYLSVPAHEQKEEKEKEEVLTMQVPADEVEIEAGRSQETTIDMVEEGSRYMAIEDGATTEL